MLAMAALTSCSKSDPADGPEGNPLGNGTAYVAISVHYPTATGTRAVEWTEQPGSDEEKAIKSLWIVPFNSTDGIEQHGSSTTIGTLAATDPVENNGLYPSEVVKVSPDIAKLLVIANPGPKLAGLLQSSVSGNITNWTTFNQAVQVAFDEDYNTVTNTLAKTETLVNEFRVVTGKADNTPGTVSYFTMINSGSVDETDKVTNTPLASLDMTKVFVVGSGQGQYSEEKAKEEAAKASNRAATVKIERMSSKMTVNANSSGDAAVVNAAIGTFVSHPDGFWTLDVLNSAFIPYAQKHINDNYNAAGGFYKYSFYTQDPNYLLNQKDFAGRTGLKYNRLMPVSLEPNVNWLGSTHSDYSMENTMDSKAQQFQNATRIVVRGYFWPAATNDELTKGDMAATTLAKEDWFRYANVNYASLTDLQTAYTGFAADLATILAKAEADRTEAEKANIPLLQAFVNACDRFYTQVKAQDVTSGRNEVSAADFAGLDKTQLANIQNGGDLVKHPDGCIRWYKGGLNYWWYEIRHDKSATGLNEQDKYGVVRNNWYSLTMTTINGAGTPWYPSVVPPGEYPGNGQDPDDPYDPTDPDKPWFPTPDPEDPYNPEPDPEDPIDKETGYISFDVQVGPWVHWEYEMPLQ